MLRLKHLSIRLMEYGPDKGRFQGEIEYAGEKGKVTVALSADDCQRLLPVVSEAIVSASGEVAEQLTGEAFASVPSEQLKIA